MMTMAATVMLLAYGTVLIVATAPATGQLRTCAPEDFHYEYTKCDSAGGRWLVSVPNSEDAKCTGGPSEAPVRGKRCDFSCKAGEYLDLKKGQECQPCPAGQYSLGGGVRYDSWEQLPTGFSIEFEEFASPVYAPQHYANGGKANCTGAGWLPRDKYLVTDLSECTSILVYIADLVQPGSVTFTYQNSDNNLLFMFEVQNSKCQTVKDKTRSRYLRTTDEGTWKDEQVQLNSGVNRLYWRAFSTVGKTPLRKNIMIQKIEITGVAYTSECTQCPPGTYSGKGMMYCLECAANTFSGKGSNRCVECNHNEEYSDPGASKCKSRPPCTADDFFVTNTPCNPEGQTQKVYKWILPHICNENKPGSVQLPPSGPLEKCPPCNPGMQMSNGVCEFCGSNQYSDGIEPCAPCRGSTAPETGIFYQWWNNLPPNANISFFCLLPAGRSCNIKEGWTTANDHIRTLRGNEANAYSLVTLHVGGFRGGKQSAVSSEIAGILGDAVVYGTISFIFELNCSSQCSFLFLQHIGKEVEVINSWSGQTPKTKYAYNVTSDTATNFSWSFQQLSVEDDDLTLYTNRLADTAKIYVISVTNTEVGGADHCKSCPKGIIEDRCIPCPEGTFVDPNTTECVSCRPNTVVRGVNAWGAESCVECGEGLEPYRKTTCINRCTFKSGNNTYDFSALAGVHTIEGPHLFTTSGYKYYHTFNISLCYHDLTANTPLAMCYSNVSKDQMDSEIEDSLAYLLPVCRSTILPSSPGDPAPPVSINPLSLSDVLLAVTNKPEKYNITEMMKEAKFYSDDNTTRQTDIHFIFMAEAATKACRNGRRTVITLRCDTKDASKDGVLSLPSHCPDGTCDGCNFLFLWTSVHACPRCSKDDYSEFKEMCISGQQRVIKKPTKLCYPDAVSIELVKCSLFWQDNWPLWLKVVVILVPVVVLLGLILCITVCYCWMKNRKLEYKYTKLIESTGGRDGELPGVDTCALDDGEEDEFDAVDFKKKARFFGKFSPYPRRGKESALFDQMSLSEKSPLT